MDGDGRLCSRKVLDAATARTSGTPAAERLRRIWAWLSAPERAPFVRLFFEVHADLLAHPENYPDQAGAVTDWFGPLRAVFADLTTGNDDTATPTSSWQSSAACYSTSPPPANASAPISPWISSPLSCGHPSPTLEADVAMRNLRPHQLPDRVPIQLEGRAAPERSEERHQCADPSSIRGSAHLSTAHLAFAETVGRGEAVPGWLPSAVGMVVPIAVDRVLSMSDDRQRVAAAWGRIETWLRGHAAASADALLSPAGEADIAAAEVAIGVELPTALAAWYRLCDGFDEGHGSGILPSSMRMLPLADLVGEYRMRTRDWEREAGILPFARTAGDTWSGWYVDARRGEPSYGDLGHWSVDGGDDLYPLRRGSWPLVDWLEEIAAALEEGRCLHRPDGMNEQHDWPVLTGSQGLAWIDPRDPRLFPGGMVKLDGPR
ncbi:SMI1/KNR4 family protein [Streptomyces malaysiensis]|nr:SMI1/KNR4 family protein [Streptomyces malaysiensis]